MSTPHPTASTPTEPGLPLVVQVSFAGSRKLYDREKHPDIDPKAFHDELEKKLTERLGDLPRELRLSKDRHFICGFSALAIGADTLFTRACQKLKWWQHLLLPQQREEFLAAVGSKGDPDFTDDERKEARKLFASDHIIHERVASDSPNRRTRFHDVNLELVRVSDVVVCLLNDADAAETQKTGETEIKGNTRELMADAIQRDRPLLEIHVGVDNGKPVFTKNEWVHREKFVRPCLPRELSKLQTPLKVIPTVPAAAAYCQPLKDFSSSQSKATQNFFMLAALVIIGTHVIATLLAVLALKLHLPWILGLEFLLLVVGFVRHQQLHHSQATQAWAMSRLVAEIARSALALQLVPGYLSPLLHLSLPRSLRPLLRTLIALHLRETRNLPANKWKDRRDAYVQTRLLDPKKGQIGYYRDNLKISENRGKLARYAFLIGSGFAIVATLGELMLAFHWLPLSAEGHAKLGTGLGTMAIVLPIVAVAALSLAASFDLEARVHTYSEVDEFLKMQKEYLEGAQSERAFCSLALETEAQLLGETVGWYWRRAFTGVT